MKRKILRNKRKKITGYIETDYKGRKILRDKERHIIGYYYPKINKTLDTFHNDVGEGDVLISMVPKK